MPDYTQRHLFIRRLDEVTRPELAEPVAYVADTLERTKNTLAEGLAEIAADTRLSSEGQESERRILKGQLREAVRKAVEPVVKDLQRRVEQSEPILTSKVRNRLRPPLPDEPWARTAALQERNEREREIRTAVRGMDETTRMVTYLAACRRADVETTSAIEGAPEIARLISKEVETEGAETFAQAAFPNEWDLFVQERLALDTVAYNARACLRDLDPPEPAVDELVA